MLNVRRRPWAGIAVLLAGLAGGILADTPVAATQQRGAGAPSAPPRDAGSPRVEALQPRYRLTANKAEAFVDAAVRKLDYLPGEAVVRFRSFVSPAGRQRALASLRGQPRLSDLEWHGPVAVVRDPTQPNAHALARQLAGQPEVAYAEPNYIARVEPGLGRGRLAAPPAADSSPNDTDYSAYQWNLRLLDMPGAWQIQPGGTTDLTVAVLDTGITSTPGNRTFRVWTGEAFEDVVMPFAVNPDLPAYRLTDARDFAFLEPSGPVLDLDGHGTHVSGTIGEHTNNAMLLAGMAYNTRIMPIKVCLGYWEIMIARAQASIPGFAPGDAGGCLYSDIADGIYYAADHGADVMNISIGGAGASTALRDALAHAVSRRVFVSVSMGNDFLNGNTVSFPARYGQDIEGVMAVGAVGKTGDRAYYSSTGPHCEIAAPGGDDSLGGGPDFGYVWQSTLNGVDQLPQVLRPRFDRYEKLGYQGTSMAAPHVAGLAALIASQTPGISPANIERIIRGSARDLGPRGKDDAFGYGLIQPRAALFGKGIRR
jgi:subtilisin family serine protease